MAGTTLSQTDWSTLLILAQGIVMAVHGWQSYRRACSAGQASTAWVDLMLVGVECIGVAALTVFVSHQTQSLLVSAVVSAYAAGSLILLERGGGRQEGWAGNVLGACLLPAMVAWVICTLMFRLGAALTLIGAQRIPHLRSWAVETRELIEDHLRFGD